MPQLPYVSTASGTQTHPSSEHLGSLALCFRTSASSAAAPTDMLASGRMETDNEDVTVTSKAACLPLSQSNVVCQLVECGCDQVLDHCLSPPSPPSGQDNRIPALDLPGDCDERPHLPLVCKWQCDCPAGQVLYLDIKSRRFLLQCSPPNHHFTAVCSSLGSRWRSSLVAGVTNSQDEACGSDMDKRRA